MRRWLTALVVASMLAVSTSPVATAQIGQPDIIQEHWYHSYATLTLDLNEWADDYPEIVEMFSIGKTELGREIWMLQIWIGVKKPNQMEAKKTLFTSMEGIMEMNILGPNLLS